MLQNFSKGEDKAFFRQNDFICDQIYFLRENVDLPISHLPTFLLIFLKVDWYFVFKETLSNTANSAFLK